jgi:hypothetical protein
LPPEFWKYLLVVFRADGALADHELLNIADGAEGCVLDFLCGGLGEVDDFSNDSSDFFAGFFADFCAFGWDERLDHFTAQGGDSGRAG